MRRIVKTELEIYTAEVVVEVGSGPACDKDSVFPDPRQPVVTVGPPKVEHPVGSFIYRKGLPPQDPSMDAIASQVAVPAVGNQPVLALNPQAKRWRPPPCRVVLLASLTDGLLLSPD